MADFTRAEAIQWCINNNVNFHNPLFPPPSGWMWAETEDSHVLTPIFTMTDQGGDITQSEVDLCIQHQIWSL